MTHNLLAVDLGASNGRVMLGRLAGHKLGLELVHRFEHQIRFVDGHKRWDWETIRQQTRTGLAKACDLLGDAPITGISCDSWAQDFGLLDGQGQLLYSPVSYRDPRCAKVPEALFEELSPEELVSRVGVGLTPITSLCQLFTMSREEPEVLAQAATFLHIADLMHYDLCGQVATDWTMASANQLLNLETRGWDTALLDQLGIPHHFLPPMYEEPGALGRIPAERAPHPKLEGVPVIISASHDTPAASAASGPFGEHTLFFSAGTYAMLGYVSDMPIVTRAAIREGCALVGLSDHRWGLFTDTPGLWILQECLRLWKEAGQNLDYGALVDLAEEATIDARIPATDKRFRAPENMLDEIRAACVDAGYRAPETPGETTRVVLDSLIDGYQHSKEALERVTGQTFEAMHIVSGGSLNRYLCRESAHRLGLPVIAGPAEATVIGNLLLQARVLNLLPSDEAVAEMMAASFPKKRYEVQ